MNTTRQLRRSVNIAIASTAFVGGLLSAQPAWAVLGPAPGSVSPETLTLPAAPGSLEGLSSAIELAAFSGQARHVIGLNLPHGAGGVQPTLALRYDGNYGDGPLGPGWSIDVPQIRRSLRHGLPSYTDEDELEAVGVGAASGRLIRLDNGEYRIAGQGERVRIFRQDNQFRMLLPGGGMWLFGYADNTRQSNESGTFAWLADLHEHPNAQVVRYTYQQLDGQAYLIQFTWDHERKVQLSYIPRTSAGFSHRAGMPQRWSQLLNQIDIRVGGERHSRWQIDYNTQDQIPRVAKVQRFGQTDSDSLPPERFGYRPASNPPTLLPFLGQLPFDLANPNVTLIDVDGDGLSDLVKLSGQDRQWARNRGDRFDAPQDFIGPNETLDQGRMRVMDINGDHRADLVVQQGEWIPWLNTGGAFQAGPGIDGSNGMSLGGNQVFADLNGDGIAELLTSNGTGLTIYSGQTGALGGEESVVLPPELSGYSLRDARLRIQDITGDGLADFIVLEPTHFTLFEGRGGGRVTVGNRQPLPQQIIDYGACHFRDLDRNGTVDMALFIDATVRWFPRLPDGSFGDVRVVAAPMRADNTSRLNFADLNGNGTVDAVWSQGDRIWAIDLVGQIDAGLLEIIDNGHGRTQTMTYSHTNALAAQAAQANRAWTSRLGAILPVVSRVDTTFADEHTAERGILYIPANPIWDHEERSFVGFGRAARHQLGAVAGDTLITEEWFHAGLGDQRSLRGKVYQLELRSGDGQRFEDTSTTWQISLPATLGAHPHTGIAVRTQQIQEIFEGEATAKTIQTTWVHNQQGDPVETRRLGEDDAAGDEQIIRQSYIYVSQDYHLWGLEYERSVHALDETIVHKSQFLFDGEMQPLPAGRATRGWLRVRRDWLESQQRWVEQEANDYDEFGNVVRAYHEGVWRLVDYDEDGVFAIAEHIEPQPGRRLTTRAQWHPVLGTMTRYTDTADVEQVISYDGLGRVIQRSIMGQSPYQSIEYNLSAPIPRITIHDHDGAAGEYSKDYLFNGAGEPIATRVELGEARLIFSQYTQRNTRGFAAKTCDPFLIATPEIPVELPRATPCSRQTYDAKGRLTEVIDPNDAWTRTTYLPLTTITERQDLEPVLRRRDGLNRPTTTQREIDGLVERARASYDAAGRLLSVDLQNGRAVHRFGYNTLGQLLWAFDPDQGRRTHTYDDKGHLITSTNAAGEMIILTYDDAGRIVSESGSQGSERTYHYDVAKSGDPEDRTMGRLAWAQEPTGTVEWRYDAFGRTRETTRFIGGQGATQSTTLSPSGRRISQHFESGPTINYGYDKGGRLVRAEPYWEATELDPAGRPINEVFGNGVTAKTERDARGLITAQTISNASGVLSDLRITRHAMGTPTQVEDRHGGGLNHEMTFDFDGAHRLQSASVAGSTISFSYDGLNNLVGRELSGRSIPGLAVGSLTLSDQHPRQLIQAGDAAISYDNAGRATSVGNKRLTWDAFDRLIALEVDGETQTHRYGVGGLRTLTERIDGRMERWFNKQHMRLGEQDHFYIEVNGRRLAKVRQLAAISDAAVSPTPPPWVPLILIFGGVWLLSRTQKRRVLIQSSSAAGILLCMGACACDEPQPPGVFYLHRTYGVGPTLITNTDGQIDEERRYTPFGHLIDGDLEAHTLGLGDQPTNPTTGWADHGARWLAHDLGRWLAPDPPLDQPRAEAMMADPWNTTNPYTAMANNPVYFEDPDGENPVAGVATFAGSLWGDVTRMGLHLAQGKTHEVMRMGSLSYLSERVGVAGARGLAAATGGLTSIAATAGVEGVASAANQAGNLGRIDGRKVAVDTALGAASAGLGSMVKSTAPTQHIISANSAISYTSGLRDEALSQYAGLQGWTNPRKTTANRSALKAATAPASFICNDRSLMSGASGDRQ